MAVIAAAVADSGKGFIQAPLGGISLALTYRVLALGFTGHGLGGGRELGCGLGPDGPKVVSQRRRGDREWGGGFLFPNRLYIWGAF